MPQRRLEPAAGARPRSEVREAGDPPDGRGARPTAARRAARAPLDVDAEVERLLTSRSAAPALAGDGSSATRSASSWSRATSAAQRQGKEPLDVEDEIERQLRELENLGQ